VAVCSSCGHHNPAGAKFCLECGAAFVTAASGQAEQRKTVTVLFCDVTGSTALGEALDPEPYRALLARYFERMKAILERHGATVEKFIGDAVMAVFGVPAAHEDDALRALRAAVEMREAFPELGVEGRIGIATGEVVTGTEERLATGDAVNVAKRLEGAASPGETLLGQETLHLAGGAAEVEPIAQLTLKGKREPVPAYRLLAVDERPASQHESRFVGRDRELAILESAWRRVLDGRRCELVTVVGEAGIGKSRLVSEFAGEVEAQVVMGRCLPYGDGITYYPVVEVMRQLGALPSDPAAAAALRSLSGASEESVIAEEIAWGFRKLLEENARDEPLLCLFDDLQWAEATFLDLLEHLALLSSVAPILLLCMARPELAELRENWPIALHLQPLTSEAVETLLPETLSGVLRAEISRRAAGNPLFLIEMAALAKETRGDLAVPSNLKALLGARLDQLAPGERRLLQCASVEGEIFHRQTLLALDPEGRQLTPRLASLVRKGLLQPTTAQLGREDAFRFQHLLLRDTAYDALPKASRACLHERLASWIEDCPDEVAELDEIVGYHLEQAAGYQQDLGSPDLSLAARGGTHLAAAGRRAAWRGDVLASRSLLGRALRLTRAIRLDIPLELDLAISQNDPLLGAAMADTAAQRAREQDDGVGEILARIVGDRFRLSRAEADPKSLEELARGALPLVEQAKDPYGLAEVWAAIADVMSLHCRFEEATHAAQEAIRYSHFGSGGWARDRLETWLALGPCPADQALRTLDATATSVARPWTALVRAVLLAMLARFDAAWSLANNACDRLLEQRGSRQAGGWMLESIAVIAGDFETAARYGREHCDHLEQDRQLAALSTAAPSLGRVLCELGRFDEAEPLAELGRELGDDGDIQTQACWRQVHARVLAHRREYVRAETVAREAVAITEPTDGLNMQGDVFCDLAKVLRAAGRTNEEATALEQAINRYERKKNLAMLAQIRPRLAELSAS
jgi:class 3 adenylate cyclase/tetratricopeptide (TPR) repeat protein